MTSEKTHTKTNLPAEPNDFIGRERDVAELRQLLAATRAVTLSGPGGIGKTRLAMRVARSLEQEYEDGVWLVELADVAAGPLDPDPVTRRVAAAFGVAEEGGRPLAETLADALCTRRTMLVIDNCEHLVEECASLCRTLIARCPRLLILATSREPLRVPGESVWRVPPLSVPVAGRPDPRPEGHEAVRLFVARATAARPDFTVTEDNAAALADLCRALDGVPLALELAAARVRVLSVEQIARRLTDRFRLLSAGDRTAPPRQRTLRAAIDWSHELLTEPERVLLRRLSVFAGWSIDQAELVCADDLLPAEDVLDLLAALVDKSLVVVDREVAGETRFRLLDSIRDYMAERLGAAGERDELRRRHRDAVLETLEYEAEIAMAERKAPWRKRVELFFKYDAEQHNVRAALAWSLAQGDIDEGLRLCLSARSYWVARGYFAEAADWTDLFLARGDEAGPRTRGPAQVGRAQLALDLRDFARAESCALTGTEHCRAVGDATMLAAGLDILAQVELRAGRFDEALARVDEAMQVARAEGDQWNEALSLLTRGSVLAQQGRLREAQHLLESGVQLMREIDQQWGAARGLAGLGMLAQARGDLGAARGYFEEALPILREIDARPEIARSLGGIGRIAIEQGDLPAARSALTDSLRLSLSIGMRIGVARGLEAFAELLAREGDQRGSVLLGGAAAALRDAIGQPPTTGARLERTLEPIRRRLGEHLVAQLWGEGRATPADAAVAYALEGPRPDDVPAPRDPGHESAGPAASSPSSTARAIAVTPPSTLTPREREIAKMIARGLSNRGIADELVISPATVARHVTNILTKLGFGSRAQIAAWAVDNLAGE